MKKSISILISMALMLALSACGAANSAGTPAASSTVSSQGTAASSVASVAQSAESTAASAADAASTDETAEGKTLVVYFSWSGNTADMASAIAEQTDGDIFEITPETPYPTEYTPCTEVALTERDENARPAIQNLPENLDGYTRIFIGYPIWWHTAPMIIGTFLENYDLAGVDIYPFSQSGSMNAEQFEASVQFVKDCAPGANVADGLFARASDAEALVNFVSQAAA